MILTGLARADTLILQTGQGGEHVHGRHIALAVHLAGEDDLTLGDVAGQVGDGVGLVVLGHGEDGDHGDGALGAHLTARSLIHGGQVGVQVAGVAAAAGNLLTGGGDLAECLGVVGDVGQNDQHVHIALKGQVLGGGQSHTGGGDTLDGGIGGQVDEEDGTVDSARLLEVGDEEVGLLEGDTDGGEDHGELGVGAAHLSLAGDLGGQVCVGQTRAREDGELLTADEGIQSVDGGDTRLDELGGVEAGGGVDGGTVDVQRLVRNQGRAVVDGFTHTVEHAAQHMLGHGQLHAVAGEAHLGLGQVQSCRGLKELYQHVTAVDLQDTATADFAIGKLDLTQLVVLDTLHLLDQHKGAGDFFYSLIFTDHVSVPPIRMPWHPEPACSAARSSRR